MEFKPLSEKPLSEFGTLPAAFCFSACFFVSLHFLFCIFFSTLYFKNTCRRNRYYVLCYCEDDFCCVSCSSVCWEFTKNGRPATLMDLSWERKEKERSPEAIISEVQITFCRFEPVNSREVLFQTFENSQAGNKSGPWNQYLKSQMVPFPSKSQHFGLFRRLRIH